jgi:hypothetical protein
MLELLNPRRMDSKRSSSVGSVPVTVERHLKVATPAVAEVQLLAGALVAGVFADVRFTLRRDQQWRGEEDGDRYEQFCNVCFSHSLHP